MFIKTTPVNPRSINTAAFNKMKAYDSIESAEGDCRTLSKMMQETNIAHRHSFRCYRNGLESRELKTLYLSDQNNQKIQNNGCQYEINEKNTIASIGLYSFEIPIGICLYEYPDRLFVAIGAVTNLEKVLISLESHCIDIPRTPVED